MRKRMGAALVLGMALAGCAGLPVDGPVNAVSPSATATAPIGLAAQPPSQGASPQEIVEGFLVACQAGLDDDFAVAREYLHSNAASSWNPMAQVIVFPDTQNVATSVNDDGAITVTVGTSGTLASNGAYTETGSYATASDQMSLAKDTNGQWRIVALADGIFLSEHLFHSMFSEIPLYFLSADSSSLVADLRYYPTKSFATNAVKGLLAGPVEWLNAATHTAVPEGTQLVSSVEVSSGTAKVDLTSQALSGSADDHAKMVAQISRTLLSSSSIRNVQVTVGGAALQTGKIPDLAVYPYGAYGLTVLQGGVPALLKDGQVTSRGLAGIVPAGLSNIAVGYDSDVSRIAALSSHRAKLVGIDAAKGTWRELASGVALVAPSYDSFGWVYTGETSNRGTIEVYNPSSGGHVTLSAGWMSGSTVQKLAVSRDGSRLVVVTEAGGLTEISVAGIQRGIDGTPEQIGTPVKIGQRISSVHDLVWIGASTVAVLGSTTAGGRVSVYSVKIGGATEQIFEPMTGAEHLTAGRDETSIVIVTDEGAVYGREGGSWKTIGQGISEAVLPG